MSQIDNEWDASGAVDAATRATEQGLEAASAATTQAAGQAEAAMQRTGAQVRDGFALMSNAGVDGGQFMLSNLKAGADSFTASVEASFSRTSETLTSLNIKAVDMLRENVNSSFELWEQMIGARTLTQVLDLQAEHARKRVELLGEQGRALTAMAEKLTFDGFAPMRAGLRKAAA